MMSIPMPEKRSEAEFATFFIKLHANQEEWRRRADVAQAQAAHAHAHAHARLLHIAETSDTGQAGAVVKFFGSHLQRALLPL